MSNEVNNNTLVSVIPAADVAASADSAGNDMAGFIGNVKFTLDTANTAGTAPTLAVKLQQSADGSTNWTDITGGGFTTVSGALAVGFQTIIISINDVQRYVRAHQVIGGSASPSFATSLTGFGLKKTY